jgi:hypothetical protein
MLPTIPIPVSTKNITPATLEERQHTHCTQKSSTLPQPERIAAAVQQMPLSAK